MPCGIAESGPFADLEEILDPSVPTKPLLDMSHAERRALVTERLRRGPARPGIAIAGTGPITRKTAIEEVERGSRLGELIVKIHLGMIRDQVERRLSGRTRPKRRVR